MEDCWPGQRVEIQGSPLSRVRSRQTSVGSWRNVSSKPWGRPGAAGRWIWPAGPVLAYDLTPAMLAQATQWGEMSSDVPLANCEAMLQAIAGLRYGS